MAIKLFGNLGWLYLDTTAFGGTLAILTFRVHFGSHYRHFGKFVGFC